MVEIMKTSKEKNFISVVVYVYNSEKTIEYFLKTISSHISEHFDKYEIICVNDASTDDTVKKIEKISKNEIDMPVSILNLSYHQGLEKAMVAGVNLSIGDFVFEFDSCIVDYETDMVYQIYQKSLEGNDIVAAVPDSKQSFFSTIFYKLINSVSKSKIYQTESFRILSRRAINRINSFTNNIFYRKVIYYNCGLKTSSIKYKSQFNAKKEKRLSFKYKQDLAVDTLLSFTNIGYKLAFYFSITMIGFSIMMILYSLFIYFLKDNVIEGWTTQMIFYSLSFGALFVLLTIIIRYISLILRQQITKENIIYESINKVNKN